MGEGRPEASPFGPDESGLEQLLAAGVRVRRHLWLVVVAALAGSAIAVVKAMGTPQLYQATVSLLVDNRPPRVVPVTTEVNPEEQWADRERFINSQIRVLTSQPISDKVEARLGMPRGSLAGAVSAFPDPKSYALAVSVSDGDPERATKMVNAFAEVFMESTSADRAGVATEAAHFLDAQSHAERKALEDAERALYDFNRSNELPASTFEESHKIASSTLEALHAQEAQARAGGIKLRAQVDEIEQAGHNPELQHALLQTEAGGRDESPASRHATAVAQLVQLEARYGPEHPKVVEAQRSVEAATKQLAEQLAVQLQAARARLHANENELAQLRRAIAEETQKAVALRQKELEYNRLKRLLDENRENYSLVSRREKEIELQATARQSYVRWLEGPSAAAPVGRRLPFNAALGLVIGLLLGIGLAYLLDLLDDAIKSPFEAEQELSPALLGIVMHIPTPEGGAHEVEPARAEYLLRNPRSVIAEQCHTLTTQVYSQFLDAPPRALMVVSSAVEDGKTLVGVNLAITVAARGKRVLLVDADLRRGRLHRLFQLPKKGGLFELVTQKVKLEEAARSTFIPNVDVVTTGEIPDKLSPLRVFEHAHLAETVEALKARYDLVVFDTPPTPLVSDALIIGGLVDGAVGVARASRTSRQLARKLSDRFKSARVNFLGWVLNDVPESELKSKYYYRYGYGRHYGYYAEESSGA
jgi:capsular exopolysaccharide synthesis family protein